MVTVQDHPFVDSGHSIGNLFDDNIEPICAVCSCVEANPKHGPPPPLLPPLTITFEEPVVGRDGLWTIRAVVHDGDNEVPWWTTFDPALAKEYPEVMAALRRGMILNAILRWQEQTT